MQAQPVTDIISAVLLQKTLNYLSYLIFLDITIFIDFSLIDLLIAE